MHRLNFLTNALMIRNALCRPRFRFFFQQVPLLCYFSFVFMVSDRSNNIQSSALKTLHAVKLRENMCCHTETEDVEHMCCHTESEVADQTCCLTHSGYTDFTRQTSHSTDPMMLGVWQGSHRNSIVVGWLFNIPATCLGISGTDLLSFICCHTKTDVADQTFHLIQSQYTDTGPTSHSTDPIAPGAWQSRHWECQFLCHWYHLTWKNPGASKIWTSDHPLLRQMP